MQIIIYYIYNLYIYYNIFPCLTCYGHLLLKPRETNERFCTPDFYPMHTHKHVAEVQIAGTISEASFHRYLAIINKNK